MATRSLSVVSTVLFTLFCYFSSIYQIGTLTSDYLDYDLNVGYEPVSYGAMSVPDLTICLDSLRRFHRNSTVHELFQHVQPFSAVLKSVHLRPPNSAKIDFGDIDLNSLLRDIFLLREYTCYVLSWSKYYKVKKSVNPSRVDSVPPIVMLRLRKKPHESIKVHISSPENKLSLSLYGNRQKSFSENVSYISLRYTKTETFRLPLPYATNCYKYDEEGIHSQEMCINDCKLGKYVRSHKYIPPSIPVINKTDFSSLRVNYRQAGIDKKIDELCLVKCKKPACLEQTFEPVVADEQNSEKYTTSFYIHFHLAESYIAIRYGVKITFTTLVVNVGSSLSWWTGLSVLGTLALVQSVKKSVVNLKQKVAVHHFHLYLLRNNGRNFRVVPLRPVVASNNQQLARKL